MVNTNPVTTPPSQLGAQFHNLTNGAHDTLNQIPSWIWFGLVAFLAGVIIAVALSFFNR